MENAKTKAVLVAKAKDYLMTTILLVCCCIVPRAYLTTHGYWTDALAFHFTHANVFHLLMNALFLAHYKPKWRSTVFGWFSASLAAFLPVCVCRLPTCGLSGVCYAMVARSNAYQKKVDWYLLLANVPMALTGVFNWRLHIISYLISFTSWTIYLRLKK